jgi:hypothetical protein
MNTHDLNKFTELWRGANEIYGSAPTDTALTLSFKLLAPYDFKVIESAVIAYLSDPEKGKFKIKPSEVIDLIKTKQNDDGRLTADEAWSLAIKSFDEYTSVMLTDDIAAALSISASIYRDGDKVGARFAFRSAYEREVQSARDNHIPNKYFLSLGLDESGRRGVIEAAVKQGQLSQSYADKMLPAPMTTDGQAIAGLLTGNVTSIKPPTRSAVIAGLQGLKGALAR